MKITIESTTQLVMVNRVPARIWEGTTESGIPCHAFITRIACQEKEHQEQFRAELQEMAAPSVDVAAYPLALII